MSLNKELLKEVGVNGSHHERWRRAKKEQQRVSKEARQAARLMFVQAWSPWALCVVLGGVFFVSTLSFVIGALTQHHADWNELLIQALTAGLVGSAGCWVLLELLGFKLRSLTPTQTDLMTQKMQKEQLAEEWGHVVSHLEHNTQIEQEARELHDHIRGSTLPQGQIERRRSKRL